MIIGNQKSQITDDTEIRQIINQRYQGNHTPEKYVIKGI